MSKLNSALTILLVFANGAAFADSSKSTPVARSIYQTGVDNGYKSDRITTPRSRVLKNGKKTVRGLFFETDHAQKLDRNFELIVRFFESSFGWRSYDGKGAPIRAIVDSSYHTMFENAAWFEEYGVFTFGRNYQINEDHASGTRYGEQAFGRVYEATDVIAHEFTHAVISSTSRLEYFGQSGALNEHLADVFGALANWEINRPEEPFLIGRLFFGSDYKELGIKAIRNMLNPKEGGSFQQPAHMSEIPEEFGPTCVDTGMNDHCGVHILSGIPNRASALIMQEMGFSETKRLFFRTMTSRLSAKSNFTDYKAALVAECGELRLERCDVIVRAFEEVGL